MAKIRIVVLLAGSIALLLVILALQLLAPGDQLEQTGPGDAHIVFSADHGMVLAPGACLTVRWQVDHVKAVHLNGQPEVGQGIQQVCVDEKTLPVLHVDFTDNTATDVTLNIDFLVEQPATWLLVVAALLLGFATVFIALSRPSMTVSSAAPGGVRRTPRVVLVFAGIGMLFSLLLIVALLLELGLRFYFGQFGSRDEQAAYLLTRSQIDALASSTLPLPLVEYGLSPDFPGHNSLGYRGDEIAIPKPSGVYRIVALGDSSTYGNYLPYDETYPYDLQQVLRNDYGYQTVEVINGGVTNYTSWNMLADLAFRIPELQPDLVIVYAGWNDIDARELSPDCYSSPSPFLGLDPKRELRAAPASLSPSALYRFLAIKFGWMPNPAQSQNSVIDSSISCQPQVIAEIPQNIEANPPVYFERNLREMIVIGKALGIKMMFMSWAFNTNISYFPEFRRPAIAQHNAIVRQVAEESGTLFFDYAAVAPTDKGSWQDVAHLSTGGALEQAQDIAKYLVEQKVIPEAPAS